MTLRTHYSQYEARFTRYSGESGRLVSAPVTFNAVDFQDASEQAALYLRAMRQVDKDRQYDIAIISGVYREGAGCRFCSDLDDIWAVEKIHSEEDET